MESGKGEYGRYGCGHTRSSGSGRSQPATTVAALYFALCFGFGYGAVAPLFPSIAADIFQGEHFGRIFGLLSLNLGFGGAAGAWFAGYIFDQTGSYQIAFIIDIIVLWLSCASFWLAAPRKIRLSPKRSD
ncbi:MAG TPA: MFS transporter [Desulfarculaceae bacterium]|nr:MFS transporter [Desulfarculaceae bacterium]